GHQRDLVARLVLQDRLVFADGLRDFPLVERPLRGFDVFGLVISHRLTRQTPSRRLPCARLSSPSGNSRTPSCLFRKTVRAASARPTSASEQADFCFVRTFSALRARRSVLVSRNLSSASILR